MTTAIILDENKVSRRSLLVSLLLGAAAATVAAVEPSEVEAQERRFTGVHHEPRHAPRGSPSRKGWRGARVHHRGRPRPHAPEAPAH
jgi:hypothetical protein